MIDKLKQDAREALLKIRTTDERHLELSDTLIETAYNAGRKSRDEEVENLMMEIKVMGEYD